MNIDKKQIIQTAKELIQTELEAVAALADRVDNSFVEACEIITNCEGRIAIIGIGKSGHIGQKIAATLSSTGNPAFFVHPAEAGHGDLGMITSQDVVIMLSNSGETEELINIVPTLSNLNIKLIVLTGNLKSKLAKKANVCIDVSVAKEACPLDLAPTSSTTAALVMGDALAIALIQTKDFNLEEFARSHPSGQLGKRLTLRAKDVMRTGQQIPIVHKGAKLKDVLIEISSKGMGMAVVLEKQKIIGVYTDGDLRRSLDSAFDIQTTAIEEVMTKNCYAIDSEQLATSVLHIFNEKKINAAPVIDNSKQLVGALNMHDLLNCGIT
ncbi:MAG: KpsF/GutQ family sugar-phosphate isomerase [Pseudomonadota bacterium]